MSAYCIACATPDFPKITPHPISQYTFFKNIDGLSIAIDPYFEEERVEQVFGINLISKGVLPIFTVIENHNKATYLIEKKQFSLHNPELENKNLRKEDTPIIDDRGLKITWGITTIAFPIVGIATSPFIASLENKNQKIVQNLIMNELPDKTLCANESSHGFIYLLLPSSETFDFKRLLILRAKGKNIRSGETLDFEFTISQHKWERK